MASRGVGPGVSGDEIIEWSREQMANYKVPRAVEIVDELPLNATGKVMKEQLRERAAGRRRRVTGDDDRTSGLSSLAGLRVVELGVWVAAPSAGALLADWGADVIKVEPPTRRPDAQRLRLPRHRRGLPEPRLRAGQPGQAQRRARPARRTRRGRGWRSCWRRRTCSSPTCAPTRSTGSGSSRRPRWRAILASSTAA